MLKFKKIYISVDPAVGEEQRHDCTAIVVGMAFSEKVAGKYTTKVYVLPKFINARLDFGNAIKAMLDMHEHVKTTYKVSDSQIKILIEQGGQQKAFYDSLKESCPFPPKYIEQVSTKGVDKRSRTAAACSYMQSKRVFLPEKGLEELTMQLLHFGSEKHDDLADSFAMMVNTAMSEKNTEIGMIDGDYFPPSPEGMSGKPKKQQEDYYRKIQDFLDRGLLGF